MHRTAVDNHRGFVESCHLTHHLCWVRARPGLLCFASTALRLTLSHIMDERQGDCVNRLCCNLEGCS